MGCNCKKDKITRVGSMEFWLRDDRNIEYNESIDCTYDLYGTENQIDEIMSIEKYWELCRSFAAAMGFCEKTIIEWFGDY